MNKISTNDLLRYFCCGEYKTNEYANKVISKHQWFSLHTLRHWMKNDNISGVALANVAKQLGWSVSKIGGLNHYRVLDEEDIQKHAQFFE